MFVVTVRISIKPGHIESFRTAVDQQAKNSLANEKACRQFDVCHAADDECAVLLYERYDDRAAFNQHLESDHFLDFDEKVRTWVAHKEVEFWIDRP